MPNWCFSTFNFHGCEDEIKDFSEKLAEWTSKEFVRTDFGKSWLGNVLYGLGLGDYTNAESPNFTKCRGCLIDGINDVFLNGNDSYFDVYTTSTWEPAAKMWKVAIEKLGYKTITVSYFGEESMNEYYVKYDPLDYFLTDWVVGDYECSDWKLPSEYDFFVFENSYFTEKELAAAICKFLHLDKKYMDEGVTKLITWIPDEVLEHICFCKVENLSKQDAFEL